MLNHQPLTLAVLAILVLRRFGFDLDQRGDVVENIQCHGFVDGHVGVEVDCTVDRPDRCVPVPGGYVP